MTIKIDKKKCTACGACVIVFPVDAITVKKTAEVDDETCIECGACVGECPADAIEQ
jgi:ferredoxin